MSVLTLSAGWQAISSLQHHLENSSWVDLRSLAAEEALADVLTQFDAGDDVSVADTGRLYHSRRLNRLRRNRKREALLVEHVDSTARPEFEQHFSDASEAAERGDFLRLLEQKLEGPDLTILKLVAGGFSYKELAVKLGMSEASLRTHACRARERARSLAA